MRHPALLLTLALSFLPAAHAAPTQPKAQQLAVFKVAALASATVTPATLLASGVTAETVTIPADYLYKRDLRVRAYDLDAFLKARIPDIEALAAQGAQVMFWCRDGYAPMAKLGPAGSRRPDRRGGRRRHGGRAVAERAVQDVRPDRAGDRQLRRVARRAVPAKPQPWGLETIYVLPAGTALKK